MSRWMEVSNGSFILENTTDVVGKPVLEIYSYFYAAGGPGRELYMRLAGEYDIYDDVDREKIEKKIRAKINRVLKI